MQALPEQIRFVSRLVLAALLSAGMTGCRTLSSKGKKATPPTASEPTVTQIPIGTVHHVDGEGGFVLIRSSRALQIEPGTRVTVVGDQGETTAALEVSPARKGQFLTADILQGTPQAGQRAIMDFDPSARKGTTGPPGAGLVSGGEVQVLE